MIANVHKNLPDYIEGYGAVAPFCSQHFVKQTDKVLPSIKDAVLSCGLKDGMTISFHHHLREGDFVLNMVMEQIAGLGIKDITIASSSILTVHEPLIEHIKNGVVTGLITSGLRGKLAKEISCNGILNKPVVFRTHGGRARALAEGQMQIDVAFIAASACDKMGNMSGKAGKSAFGSMGYALVDAKYAKKVVCISDCLKPYPLAMPSIDQTYVDAVVVVDEIGDISKISSGATRLTPSDTELIIAQNAAHVLIASGCVKNGFSFQAGSGGASLAVIRFLREYMLEHNIKGGFISGGITSNAVALLEEGLFEALLDTQTFDSEAVKSFARNPKHIEMSAAMYADPCTKGCVAHMLDMMILSATEIDINFNVNVLTGSNGIIIGAQGGHPDTAAGAGLTIVTAPLMRKNRPIVLEKVTTVVTPGEYIDVLVTECGIAVNPKNKSLQERLVNKGIELVTVEELHKWAMERSEDLFQPHFEDKIVGVVESRAGTVMDIIRKVRA